MQPPTSRGIGLRLSSRILPHFSAFFVIIIDRFFEEPKQLLRRPGWNDLPAVLTSEAVPQTGEMQG
jgi:hypothetical protein